jgi:hypothetical protein
MASGAAMNDASDKMLDDDTDLQRLARNSRVLKLRVTEHRGVMMLSIDGTPLPDITLLTSVAVTPVSTSALGQMTLAPSSSPRVACHRRPAPHLA